MFCDKKSEVIRSLSLGMDHGEWDLPKTTYERGHITCESVIMGLFVALLRSNCWGLLRYFSTQHLHITTVYVLKVIVRHKHYV